MDSVPMTDKVAGEPMSATDKTLNTGASLVQSFHPIKRVCAHLNAFHAYADEPARFVEANHYCSQLNEDFRQCLLYDSPDAAARLIGIEYMISPRLYATLDVEEKKLWHSHVYEVKSGMLIMPAPTGVLAAAWEVAENKEMETVLTLYGKVYHLWQTDRGHQVPVGEPKLMTSYTAEGQFPGFEEHVRERDGRFGEDYKHKQKIRRDIKEPEIEAEADWAWKQRAGSKK